MQVRNRYFESDSLQKLCAFEVSEGETWARPAGSDIVHCEPIISGGYMTGMFIWALVPQPHVYEGE